jgi:hypothetical protein
MPSPVNTNYNHGNSIEYSEMRQSEKVAETQTVDCDSLIGESPNPPNSTKFGGSHSRSPRLGKQVSQNMSS